MRYEVQIEGLAGIIMHNGATGLDNRHPWNVEKAAITKKRASSRTETEEDRLKELECLTSLWLNDDELPTIPTSAIRAMLETAARKLKEGPMVREGLIVESVAFGYDRIKLGEDLDQLSRSTQYTVGVVVQRNRILRTRARFLTWSANIIIDADDDLVDEEHLANWFRIGGRRIGLGDWRPEKSGSHGRFKVDYLQELKDDEDFEEVDAGGRQPDDLDELEREAA